jgi:large subunit ribosomal protein L9
MATSVQVVLREDVAKLGKIGELVRVKPGYARNFLLPRGLGVVATEGNIQQIEHERKAAIANAAKLKKSFEAIAQQLSTVTITLTKQAGEADKLYGSVTTKEISDALKAKGFEVEKKRVELPEVRTLGSFEVKAKLAPDVVATFKLEVVKK